MKRAFVKSCGKQVKWCTKGNLWSTEMDTHIGYDIDTDT